MVSDVSLPARGQRNLISIASASAVDAGIVTARGHARETLRRGRRLPIEDSGGTGLTESGIMEVEEFRPRSSRSMFAPFSPSILIQIALFRS